MKALALILALVPMPALALSCMPYRITDAYRAAAESDAPYVIVRGTLRFDAGAVPAGDHSGQTPTPARTVIPAEIEGVALGPRGQRVAKRYELKLEVYCSGPWCARAEPGDALVFLRRDGRQYVLEDRPCGAFLFRRPSAEDVQSVQRCLDGGACPASRER